MTPTCVTFVSQCDFAASWNFAVSHGALDVLDLRSAAPLFNGRMPIISFAWMNKIGAVRHRPIPHGLN